MATMVAYTTLNLSKEQQSTLCNLVETGCAEAFEINKAICELMIQTLEGPESYGPSAAESITYFIYTKPNKTDDMKRKLVKNLYDATVEVVGQLGKNKVVVIIKEHPDNNVGVDGVLKLDM